MPQFLILAEDYKDADALSRRLAVREEHLRRMRTEKAEGRFVIGGARAERTGKHAGRNAGCTIRKWRNCETMGAG